MTTTDFTERIKAGDICVALQFNGPRNEHNKVGDIYIFNYENYKVMEICEGDLGGYCWIGREK